MKLFSIFGELLLKDSASSAIDKVGGKAQGLSSIFDMSFGKIAGIVAKVGAAIGVSMGFKSLFDKAVAGQQAMAQMGAVLQSTGGKAGMTQDALVKLADAQAKVTTFSKGTNIATENLLLTFTNIGQKTFPQALSAVNDMSQALGQDTKSSAIQLGKALNDPLKGITALQRVGVTFSAQQKEQIKNFMDAGNVAAAQGIILKELSTEFGGSATAAGKTFSGQLTILRNQLTGVGVGIVSKLLPPLTEFITSINQHMPQIQAVVTKVFDAIGQAITFVTPYFRAIILDIISIATQLFPKLGNATSGLDKNISSLVQGALSTLKAVFDWLAQHGELVRAVIVGITAAVTTYKIVTLAMIAVQEIQNALLAISAIRYGSAALAQTVMKSSTTSATVAQWLLNAALSANPIGIVIIAIGALVAALVYFYRTNQTVRDIVNGVWNTLRNVAGSVVNTIIGFFQRLASGAMQAANGIVNGFNSAISFLSSLPSRAFAWGADFINGLKNGIMSRISGIVDSVKNVAGQIASFLHFSTPDVGPLSQYGQWMPDFMDGLAQGIDKNKFKVTNAIQGLSKDMSVGVKVNPSSSSIANSQVNSTDSLLMQLIQAVKDGKNIQIDGVSVAKQIAKPISQQLATQSINYNLAYGRK